jgi:rhamnose utilization protein RhaD (predicted bifunctional aldolase and dehydrogenase)/NAD(P)-dependent dehydrogenase (short-subunit alcohol dehydrogenase family)
MADKLNWPTFAASASPMDTIIGLSRFVGATPSLVLAGGGNTSCKTADTLYVKASGFSLSTITADGFVALDRAALQSLVEATMPADVNEREAMFKHAFMSARREPEKNQRPSVECVLHHLMPCTYVVHTHPTVVNMLTCNTQSEKLFSELFGDEYLYVPFVDPGLLLAKTLATLMADFTKRTGKAYPAVVLMANHGLLVCGDSADEIQKHTDKVIAAIEKRLAEKRIDAPFGAIGRLDPEKSRALINLIGPALRGLLADSADALKIVTFDDSDIVMSLVGSATGRTVAMGGPLSPDQIVYCKAFPMWFAPKGDTASAIVTELRSAIDTHTAETKFPPKVVLVAGLGMFCVGDDFRSADTVRAVYADAITVMAGAKRLGDVQYMSARDREFIENWEVESYRRKVSSAGGSAGRAIGKVALVTGAAQGFGLEIAQDLASQGAHVVLADINIDGVTAAAGKIAEQFGAGRSLGIAANVTQGASIADGLHRVVRMYGGIDLFVSNAGVLKAESVKTQSQKDFDFVTAVNYTGYFLCVQNVAPIFATQRLARSDYFSDIIQINSKSGLEGSNRNAAYAGSKFGGIGLTQSFALELIDDGVKVNSICPGNFFDGPLWSNPDNGLFVQYLRTGKVPGAKTIDDVRKFYEAKVPMKRGCRTADVMRAIYYLVEQKYETGQAVPVTGGQVMLN